MRESELTELRRLLDERREDLKSVIVATEARVREEISPDPSGDSRVDYNHPADMIGGEPDFEKDLRLVERQRAELTLVEQALHRMDEGDYGDCEACGEEIGVDRLRAVPYTRYCVDCQEKAERRHREEASGAPVRGEEARPMP